MKQKPHVVRNLSSWLLISLAGCLFFLSMSSLAWGIIGLVHQDVQAIWFLGGGVLLQGVAIVSACLAEKKDQPPPTPYKTKPWQGSQGV